MLIYFVRHGQTDWNKALRWQGSSDVPLNEAGKQQAQNLRQLFIDRKIYPALIVSSPMLRAQASASAIASAVRLSILVEPAFREINLGEFEGKTTEALTAEYGDVFEQWLDAHHALAAPGGENIEMAISRMAEPFKRYLLEYKDKGDIVIVAHQAILMAMKAALSEDQSPKALAGFKQANTQIDVWDVSAKEIFERIEI